MKPYFSVRILKRNGIVGIEFEPSMPFWPSPCCFSFFSTSNFFLRSSMSRFFLPGLWKGSSDTLCNSTARNFRADTEATNSKLVADVPVSTPQTQVAQLEATIRSAHALLQAGLIDEAISLLAAFSPEVQPNIDRELNEVRSNVDRTLPNAGRW